MRTVGGVQAQESKRLRAEQQALDPKLLKVRQPC